MQVNIARLIAAAGLSALTACGGDCGARLTVLNASGLAIASGTLGLPGSREAVPLGSLPSPGTWEHRFTDIRRGAYSVEIRFSDGSSLRDTSLGHLARGARFEDTLIVHASDAPLPLALKQSPGVCREAPRMKTVVREILKKAF